MQCCIGLEWYITTVCISTDTPYLAMHGISSKGNIQAHFHQHSLIQNVPVMCCECVQGDFDEDGDQGGRFRGKPLEPYTKQLADE